MGIDPIARSAAKGRRAQVESARLSYRALWQMLHAANPTTSTAGHIVVVQLCIAHPEPSCRCDRLFVLVYRDEMMSGPDGPTIVGLAAFYTARTRREEMPESFRNRLPGLSTIGMYIMSLPVRRCR